MIQEIRRTNCPMDCPDTCALEVGVEGGRVSRIAGARDAGVTDGFICTKVARFARRVYHAERVLHPLRRVGAKGSGAFERVSWDDAIAEITQRFRQVRDRWGGEAILPYHYGGSNGLLTDECLDRLYFARLGASRLAKTVCAAPTTAVAVGMYGKMPGVAYEDYPRAKCILVWGMNPKASSIHLVPLLREAKRNGAYIAVIDPRRNFSRREIDLHLPVRPGTDLPLALGLIRRWVEMGALDRGFLDAHTVGAEALLVRAMEWPLERTAEVTGLPADDVERLAIHYAEAHPALIRCGWGVERNRNGGQAVAAILAMPALLGKFGVRGGGYTMSNSGAARAAVDGVLGHVPWETRIINMNHLGRCLNDPPDPPIKALFVYNSNPAVTVPDQNAVLRGLAREDLFTVVLDQVKTDTAAHGDVVLPATTFLEHWDLRVSYGNYVVAGVRPVIAPSGEARSNAEVFGALGRAMGWRDAPFAWDGAELLARVAPTVQLGARSGDAERFREGGWQRFDFPGETPVQFETVHPRTPDAKVDLTPAPLGPRPYVYEPVADARFPLALISPGSSRMISSSLGEYNYPELTVTVNPADAASRGIGDRQMVRVFNDLGEVRCRARVSDVIRRGAVSMPKGAWRRASANGRTSTALCPDHVNVVGGGACFNDALVEIEPSR